jgi:hypothetical protein
VNKTTMTQEEKNPKLLMNKKAARATSEMKRTFFSKHILFHARCCIFSGYMFLMVVLIDDNIFHSSFCSFLEHSARFIDEGHKNKTNFCYCR